MTGTAAASAGRVVLAGLLCAVLAGCGTARPGEAAAPPPAPTAGKERCDLDGPGGGTATPDIPTEEQTGSGYAGPPTDQDDGVPDPPTESDTGVPGPPTDQDTGVPDPPTESDTGVPDPPTESQTGTPDPPTDGGPVPGTTELGPVTNGAGPCGAAGWFDMTKDFVGYFGKHREEGDVTIPLDGVAQVRVRKVHGVGLAEVAFTTTDVGKGRGDAARRVVEVFTAWRREVYGDTGTITARTREEYPVVVTESW